MNFSRDDDQARSGEESAHNVSVRSAEGVDAMQGEAHESVTIVVPCFNESQRLDSESFLKLAAVVGVKVLFVDDGSSDDTFSLLTNIASMSESIDVLRLFDNVGKGEAVRRGFIKAIADNANVIGYLDADLSTPVDECIRLVEVLYSNHRIAVVMGSRIKCMGTDIYRHPMRHMMGRVYATGAAIALGINVYDTQCGAKVFAVNELLRSSVTEPFGSRWAFDVRLLNRLLNGTRLLPGLSLDQFVEVPLKTWRDVPGSTLRLWSGLWAFLELIPIALSRRKVRERVDNGIEVFDLGIEGQL